MILVDTSIWIDHLRKGDALLAKWLDDGLVLSHPFVVGELALGNMRERDRIIAALQNLPQATVATDEEILQFIEQEHLHGRGLGLIDVHLLAAARLTPGTLLWSRDKRLAAAAGALGLFIDGY